MMNVQGDAPGAPSAAGTWSTHSTARNSENLACGNRVVGKFLVNMVVLLTSVPSGRPKIWNFVGFFFLVSSALTSNFHLESMEGDCMIMENVLSSNPLLKNINDPLDQSNVHLEVFYFGSKGCRAFAGSMES